MRIGQTSIIVFVSKLLSSALGFIATLYFARELGADIIGYFATTIALVSWLKLTGDLGVSHAVRKRISEGEDISEYATAGTITIITFAVIISVGVLLLDGLVESYVGRPVAIFVVLLLCAQLLKSMIISLLEGDRMVHISGILEPFQTGSRAAVQIGLVVVGFGLSGIFIGQAAGWILASIVGVLYISTSPTLPSRYHFERLYDYAKYSWLGALESRSFRNVDILLLGVFSTPKLVGVYSVSWSLATFLTIFGGAVRSALFPEISRSDAKGDRQQVTGYLTDGLSFGGLLIIPGFVGAIVLGDRILQVYGQEFIQGASVFGFLVLACLLHGYQRQLLNGLSAIDRPDLSFRVNLVFIVANTIGNAILIIWVGWVGAAIASVISTALGVVLAYRTLQSQLTFSTPWKAIGEQIFAAGVMGICVYLLRLLIGSSTTDVQNIIVVLFIISVGAGIYFLTLFKISTNFQQVVQSNLPSQLS
ncbi:lipid II flippase MurJ [Halorubrum distributum]|jgi:O-antigen/teichoic acid export membrane protein|uniref:Polysaccharide biosynthesis protein n=1 Tax=Halorubrum distributum JCM 13916 TaxID=1230455 RepID=M0PPX7_9EURY|nr:polysaccharide biosynthesis C-terminal domain-containing protein [Halorubrum arcis]EMA72083.1 polysaccharide biosynthesis protein [Halorubrum arcis JCM 13916]